MGVRSRGGTGAPGSQALERSCLLSWGGLCMVVRRQQALHAPQYHGLQGLGEAKCNMESEASRGNVRESQGEEFNFHVVASA